MFTGISPPLWFYQPSAESLEVAFTLRFFQEKSRRVILWFSVQNDQYKKVRDNRIWTWQAPSWLSIRDIALLALLALCNENPMLILHNRRPKYIVSKERQAREALKTSARNVKVGVFWYCPCCTPLLLPSSSSSSADMFLSLVLFVGESFNTSSVGAKQQRPSTQQKRLSDNPVGDVRRASCRVEWKPAVHVWPGERIVQISGEALMGLRFCGSCSSRFKLNFMYTMTEMLAFVFVFSVWTHGLQPVFRLSNALRITSAQDSSRHRLPISPPRNHVAFPLANLVSFEHTLTALALWLSTSTSEENQPDKPQTNGQFLSSSPSIGPPRPVLYISALQRRDFLGSTKYRYTYHPLTQTEMSHFAGLVAWYKEKHD